MIINKKYEIKISKKNSEWLKNKGYDFNLGDIIIINTEDLPKGSHKIIKVKCDKCDTEKEIMFQKYLKNISNGGYYACSSKCAQDKVKNTSKKKYGVEYYIQTEEYKIKIKKTSLEKYGVEHFTQAEIVKNKQKQTCLEKYDYVSYLQSDEYKIKIKKYLGEYENFFQLPNIKEKIKETNLKNLGVEYPMQSNIIKEKVKETNLKNLGVEHPMQSDIIKEKQRKTLNIKYGVDNIFQDKKIIEKIIEIRDIKIIENIKNNINDNYKLIDTDIHNGKYTFKCNKNHIFKVNRFMFYNRTQVQHTILCTECNPIKSFISGKEIQLYDFIRLNYDGLIKQSDRKILNGKEIDILLPEIGLGFEFNGSYWHSEKFRTSEYHHDKVELSLEKGVKLIHVWEDVWDNQLEMIKKQILYEIKKRKEKI